MKVKQLIEELKALNPESRICLFDGMTYFNIGDIEDGNVSEPACIWQGSEAEQ